MNGTRRLSRLLASLSLVGTCIVAGGACSAQPPPPPWVLVWSDEFNQGVLDRSKWNVEMGPGEDVGTQQVNADNPNNVTVSGGYLTLSATTDTYDDDAYSSGRIDTGGLFSQQYGRFEASIKIPQGAGMWPAFWLLGTNESTVGWPTCGEIDIMENRGADPTSVLGSLHGPSGSPSGYTLTAGYQLPGGASFSDAFHQFAVEWEPGVVRFYVDDTLYETQSSDLLPATQSWAFAHAFFIVIDLAVGGQFGPLGASTTFPQTMLVDYVHVYARPGESPGVDAG
jgi:beta-glucanase (GH16 family)